MEFRELTKSARSLTIEMVNENPYETKACYNIYVNDKCVLSEGRKNVVSIYDLEPSTIYDIKVENCETKESVCKQIETLFEYVLLDAAKFGAIGDGVAEDTAALQAAISSCPKDGCVYIGKGTYVTGPLFLKSDMTLWLDEGATLLGLTDRNKYPILPGYTLTTDEKDEYYLGTWEGNPLDMMASILTGIHVENVKIIGKGVLDGNGQNGDWWLTPKQRTRAWRPRMVFLKGCKHITIQGITVQNSPCWTIHPYFSEDLKFIDMVVHNPSNSPNTDGIDPESCNRVEIIGTKISVGDDCIAIKSGKLYMGQRLKTPSRNFTIRNCMMERGHGAVVLGSEIAGGVQKIHVSQCVFAQTDRGLRIKTRRGRGKDSIIDQITFEKIEMTEVLTPFVINMFYFCDPDGKSEYVWSKEKLPVDDWTPYVGRLTFRDIVANECEVAAGYFHGLPEMPIKEVIIENVAFSFKEEATADVPAMMSFLEPMQKQGIIAKGVETLRLKNVCISGHVGDNVTVDSSVCVQQG